MKLDNIGWNRRTKKKRSEKGKHVSELFEFITAMTIVTFLQGAPMSLRKYSRENQMMQIVSVIASRGLSFESDDDGGDQDHVTVECPHNNDYIVFRCASIS